MPLSASTSWRTPGPVALAATTTTHTHGCAAGTHDAELARRGKRRTGAAHMREACAMSPARPGRRDDVVISVETTANVLTRTASLAHQSVLVVAAVAIKCNVPLFLVTLAPPPRLPSLLPDIPTSSSHVSRRHTTTSQLRHPRIVYSPRCEPTQVAPRADVKQQLPSPRSRHACSSPPGFLAAVTY